MKTIIITEEGERPLSEETICPLCCGTLINGRCNRCDKRW